MGFMQSYKHLDNLCKDMNGVGITGYIEDMEQKRAGEFYVPGWKADYLSLKHYRYVRNQIAHENDADEENMCSNEDVAWIESFYQRVMHQTDPLALYYKEHKHRSASGPAKPLEPQTTPYVPDCANAHRETQKTFGCGQSLLLMVGIAAAVIVAVTLYMI